MEPNPRTGLAFSGLAETNPAALELRAARMESLAALAGGVTHELNNLLATVMMSVELLRRGSREPGEQQILTSLEDITRRGLHVVRQLLWLARGVEGEPTLLQLSYLVADVQKLARAAFPRTIEVVSDYPSDLWLVHGDALAASQLLLALLLEASEALGPYALLAPDTAGTLRITARNELLDAARGPLPGSLQPGPYVVLEATGTPAASQPAVRKPARSARPDEPPALPAIHSALRVSPQAAQAVLAGISACGGFSEAWQEDPDAEGHPSPQSRGRRVYLPAVAPRAPRQESLSAEPRRGTGELILIVEQEVGLAGMLRSALEHHGYRAITLPFPPAPHSEPDPRLRDLALIVTTPTAARAAVALAPPRSGGRSQREVPVLILEAAESVPAAGRPGHLTLHKPFTTRQLLAAVASALD